MLGSWPRQPVEDDGCATPLAVDALRRGFRHLSPWTARPFVRRSVAGAACSLTVDLIRAYAESSPDRLCLHAAAATAGDRLLVLIGPSRAGKSTLLAHLAGAGLTVFADDALPITSEGQGFALGIAPRLRTPLPARNGGRFRAFVAAHEGPSDRHNLYLDLPPRHLAPFGSSLPIGCIVLLDRRGDGPAILEPTAAEAVLGALVTRNIAGSARAVDTFAGLHRLCGSAPCLTLTFGDAAEATRLLLAHGARPASPSGETARARGGAAKLRPVPPSISAELVDDGAARWRRADGLLSLEVGSDLFLVDRVRNAIDRLNPVAAGVWRLLGEALSTAEILNALTGAFPSVPEPQLRVDLDRLLLHLSRSGLLRERARSEPIDPLRAPQREATE